MLTVILTRGCPGSGKSTWCKSLIDKNPNKYKRINKDDLRAMLDNSNYTKTSEKFILQVRDQIILLALKDGKHILIDDTNLNPIHESHIRQLVKGLAEVEIKDFTDVPIETCIKQDLKRFNSVGEKVIRDMYNKYLKPKAEVIPVIEGFPHAIIVDLDGTVSLFEGLRSPYDASTCENDILNQPIAEIIYKFMHDKSIIFMSGREDKYREQTIKFLSKHNLPFYNLFMRPSGDMRKDSIVKRELFDTHVRGKFNVDFVLDDRSSVVSTWRSMGLTCLQVAEGDF